MLAFNLFASCLYGDVFVTFGVFPHACATRAFNVQLWWSLSLHSSGLVFWNGWNTFNWSSMGFYGGAVFGCVLSQPIDPEAYTWYEVRLQPGFQACRSRPGASHTLIPCVATYLTERTGPSTSSLPWKMTTHAYARNLSVPSPKWWFNSLRMLRVFCGALACWELWA